MALNSLQNHLERIYRVSVDHCVEDFLITDADLARRLDTSESARDAREKLLVRQSQDSLDLSLYLDKAVVDHVDGQPPEDWLRGEQAHEFLLAVEGVSHFLYLTWNAGFHKPVTLMELEMQAEVDKFVTGALFSSVQSDVPRPQQLLDVLFDRASFDDTLSGEDLAMYRNASRYAARYCKHLECRFGGVYGGWDMMEELRYFYRLDQPEKVRHIEASA